jgi:hypothetical protein
MNNNGCDVAVIGAGASGIAAAITAARLGKKVILFERNTYLGGEVVGGMHSYLCGLFNNHNDHLINAGVAKEMRDLLFKRGAELVRMGKVYALRFQSKDFTWAAKRLIKHKNLKVLQSTSVVNAVVKNNKIISISVQNKKSNVRICPKTVVDCSGAVIKKVKASILRDENIKHLGGYCFKVSANCRDELLGVKIMYCLRKAVDEKKLPWYFRLTQTTILNKQAAVIKMSMPYDAAHIRRANSDAKKLFSYLRKNIDDLITGKIVAYGVLLERSGVRLQAKKILSQDDVILGRQYMFDVAARGAWPIEFWGEKGIEYAYCQKDHYDIPQDCLRAKSITNLFAGGRFIGADVKALAAVRVAGLCLATGEAAGRLAAKAV